MGGQTGTLSNGGMDLTIMGALAQLLEADWVGVEAHVRDVPNQHAAALDLDLRPVLCSIQNHLHVVSYEACMNNSRST